MTDSIIAPPSGEGERPPQIALYYDTETTGLPLWSEPSEDPRQPHIVQLGACLVDLDTRDVIDRLDAIVRPDGWVIPDEVAAVHGITTERALAEGFDEADVLNTFLCMWDQAQVRIGHNESFDARIIRIATLRYSDEEIQARWKNGKAECTARLSTKICALPPTPKMRAAKRFHFKTPNLTEAYAHFTGAELEGAHSAMVDVQACMAVHRGILDHVGGAS